MRSFVPDPTTEGDDSDEETLASLAAHRTTDQSPQTGSASDSGAGRPRRDRRVPLKLQDPLMVSPVASSSAAASPGKRKGGVKLMVKGLDEDDVCMCRLSLRQGLDEDDVCTSRLSLRQGLDEDDVVVDTVPDDGEEEEDEDDLGGEEEEDSDGWQSEDDPDKLWCICRQPHNNRFMICCDKCEDWFHGNCVGVTRAMGAQMEEEGRDWVCPLCKRKQKQREAAEREAATLARQAARAKAQAAHSPRKTVRLKAPTVGNLKSWLKMHPSFEVLKPGMLPTTKFYGKANVKTVGAASAQQTPHKPSVHIIRPSAASVAAHKESSGSPARHKSVSSDPSGERRHSAGGGGSPAHRRRSSGGGEQVPKKRRKHTRDEDEPQPEKRIR
ncbi:Death-inducer obliterator 1 [Amphibalanus amphitrite]|uniref:Death-inducer obliterator 1 n=1 Tax=Amphibalanus amphitrite TaxID=1232801 RepID=A0A6A4VQ38_AMPAM|nr:Death-inducer obliterator 1 [Amphibalanus amphitrite]